MLFNTIIGDKAMVQQLFVSLANGFSCYLLNVFVLKCVFTHQLCLLFSVLSTILLFLRPDSLGGFLCAFLSYLLD